MSSKVTWMPEGAFKNSSVQKKNIIEYFAFIPLVFDFVHDWLLGIFISCVS